MSALRFDSIELQQRFNKDCGRRETVKIGCCYNPEQLVLRRIRGSSQLVLQNTGSAPEILKQLETAPIAVNRNVLCTFGYNFTATAATSRSVGKISTANRLEFEDYRLILNKYLGEPEGTLTMRFIMHSFILSLCFLASAKAGESVRAKAATASSTESAECRFTATHIFKRVDETGKEISISPSDAMKNEKCPKLVDYSDAEKAFKAEKSVQPVTEGLYGTTVYNGFADVQKNSDILNTSLTDLEHQTYCSSSDAGKRCISFEKGIMLDDGPELFGHAPERHVYSLQFSEKSKKAIFLGQGPRWKESEYSLDGTTLRGPDGLIFTKKANVAN